MNRPRLRNEKRLDWTEFARNAKKINENIFISLYLVRSKQTRQIEEKSDAPEIVKLRQWYVSLIMNSTWIFFVCSFHLCDVVVLFCIFFAALFVFGGSSMSEHRRHCQIDDRHYLFRRHNVARFALFCVCFFLRPNFDERHIRLFHSFITFCSRILCDFHRILSAIRYRSKMKVCLESMCDRVIGMCDTAHGYSHV